MEVCYLITRKIVRKIRRSKSSAAPVVAAPEVNNRLDDDDEVPYQLLFPSTTGQRASPSSSRLGQQARAWTGTKSVVELSEEDVVRLSELGINLMRPRIISLRECAICTESFPPSSFISTQGCAHEYCKDCTTRHTEAKIASGSTHIQCPRPKCTHTYSIHQLSTAIQLSPSQLDTLSFRLAECAIPASLRVYCPVATCSAFMEKSGVEGTYAVCAVCDESFCQSCNVHPWHSNQSCGAFRAHQKNAKLSGDQKLLELAVKEKWKHCPECRRIVERTSGCRHMTCLCKNEFCYLCGTSFVNKVAACDC